MSHHKPDPNKNVNLTINGIPVTVPEGTRILEAARKVGVKIPTLCEHPDLCKRAVCRLCVVEVDGRGKLAAACANDVWEGISVVTHNARIIAVRKTIVELILANHPNDCLNCIRNRCCDLQTLAADFGIRESPFRHDEMIRKPPLADAGTLIRDMDKCIKCGRCVEACQEVQTVRAINTSRRGAHYEISAPYGQALDGGPCVFCGHCASVCPVGALYGHDQSGEAWAALRDSGRHVVAQLAPQIGAAFDDALGLAPGTVSAGKITSALKLLGFAKVFNAGFSAGAAAAGESRELLDRIESGGRLPMITGCSPGCRKFIADSWPAYADHFALCETPQQIFGGRVKAAYASAAGIDPASVTAVSVEPCIAHKYKADVDLALTAAELVRMFRPVGIDLAALPETPFDVMDEKEGAPLPCSPCAAQQGVQEIKLTLKGTKAKMLLVSGYANARAVMDSLSKGECGAAWIKITACPPASPARKHCPAVNAAAAG